MISFYELGKIIQEVNMTALLGIDCATDPKKKQDLLWEKNEVGLYISYVVPPDQKVFPLRYLTILALIAYLQF